MYTTFLVYSTIGEASDAIKNSSLPTPITIGLPFFAAINVSGSFLSKITMA